MDVISPQQYRRDLDDRIMSFPAASEPVARVENLTIPGPGGDLPLRLYAPAGSDPLPLVIYLHGGMVMKPEPLFAAVENVLGIAEGAPAADAPRPDIPIILLCPQGRTFTQAVAQELSAHERILLICGRYEGVDERVRQHLATDAISIGDYVLSGGELPAMILVEAVARLLPGVLGDPLGAQQDSFAMGLLEYPHYTRPAEFRGLAVPEVLLSGNHAEIARWRRREALRRTWQRRPDLLDRVALSESDRRFLSELAAEDSAGRE
jgi:tRNA (guanine37-N1)-methyltransferase